MIKLSLSLRGKVPGFGKAFKWSEVKSIYPTFQLGQISDFLPTQKQLLWNFCMETTAKLILSITYL